MSGIGGRAPRHVPALVNGRPVDRYHRNEHLLPEPFVRDRRPESAATRKARQPDPAWLDEPQRLPVEPFSNRAQHQRAARVLTVNIIERAGRRPTGDEYAMQRRRVAQWRRDEQRSARIAAGVDRSSPPTGRRPRWSR